MFEAESPASYPAEHELRKLTGRPYTPVFVFLDGNGKKVAETNGFGNPREAKALHEFVAKKQYLKTGFREFLDAYPK